MHQYLNAIGFGSMKSKKELYEILDKVEQQYINEAIKIIMAHLFMCVDDLKDKGFTYDDFKDYI